MAVYVRAAGAADAAAVAALVHSGGDPLFAAPGDLADLLEKAFIALVAEDESGAAVGAVAITAAPAELADWAGVNGVSGLVSVSPPPVAP